MKRIVTFGLISLLLWSKSLAADYMVNICMLQSHSDRNFAYLRPCNGWVSKNSCPNNDWVTWDISKFQGQLMYSTALTAMLADKKVTLRLNNSSCNSYDVTTMIRINND